MPASSASLARSSSADFIVLRPEMRTADASRRTAGSSRLSTMRSFGSSLTRMTRLGRPATIVASASRTEAPRGYWTMTCGSSESSSALHVHATPAGRRRRTSSLMETR